MSIRRTNKQKTLMTARYGLYETPSIDGGTKKKEIFIHDWLQIEQ